MAKIKNGVRTKDPTNTSPSVEVALLIERSSIVIELVVEDPPSSVLFISYYSYTIFIGMRDVNSSFFQIGQYIHNIFVIRP